MLHAVGNYTHLLFPDLRVEYVSSEEFTNDFINSLRDDRRTEFKHRYRDEVDVLLIDDIQFLIGRESTQEEFFHTFNALHDQDKQIIVTSDRPPAQLATLARRLQTRFQGGLITDIQLPDLETRVAILRKKAQASGVVAPDDVLMVIATRADRSIRELEGALIRVAAHASLCGKEIDRRLAEDVLSDLMPRVASVTAQQVLELTADHFGVTVNDLRGRRRTGEIVMPRQIAMYLCRDQTTLSLAKIGKLFDRHYSTVLHAEQKVTDRMRTERDVHDHVIALIGGIRRCASAG